MMVGGFFSKLDCILGSAGGWAAVAATSVINFFAGYGSTFTFVLMAVALDLAWGIASAVKRGQFARSELARDTFAKLSVYVCVLILFVGFDKIVAWDGGITFSVVAGMIVLVELWSMCASALIVYPRMPLLHLLRKVLAGEIAHKLGVDSGEVEEELKKASPPTPPQQGGEDKRTRERKKP